MSWGKFNNRRPMVPPQVVLDEQLAEVTARKKEAFGTYSDCESDRYAWEESDDWHGFPNNDNDRDWDDDTYADILDPFWNDPHWDQDYIYA